MDPAQFINGGNLGQFEDAGIKVTQDSRQEKLIARERFQRAKQARLRSLIAERSGKRNGPENPAKAGSGKEKYLARKAEQRATKLRESTEVLHAATPASKKTGVEVPSPEDRFFTGINTSRNKNSGLKLIPISRAHLFASMITCEINRIANQVIEQASRLSSGQGEQAAKAELTKLASILIKHFEPGFIARILDPKSKTADRPLVKIIDLKLGYQNKPISLNGINNAEEKITEAASSMRKYIYQHYQEKEDAVKKALENDFYSTISLELNPRLKGALYKLIKPPFELPREESKPYLKVLVECFNPHAKTDISITEGNRSRIRNAIELELTKPIRHEHEQTLLKRAAKLLLDLAS